MLDKYRLKMGFNDKWNQNARRYNHRKFIFFFEGGMEEDSCKIWENKVEAY